MPLDMQLVMAFLIRHFVNVKFFLRVQEMRRHEALLTITFEFTYMSPTSRQTRCLVLDRPLRYLLYVK